MASARDWSIPPAAQPRRADFAYDLDRALSAVVGIRTMIPEDAFTADQLGTERSGNGVFIDDGIVLTIGYLITEAASAWIMLADGRVVQGHPLGYDQETGFGLVQALGRIEVPSLPLGSSSRLPIGEQVVVAGVGGRRHAVAARVAAKQEFAGYWEYVLDEAIFTSPAHPNWGGAALIGPDGDLLGIGSLQLEQQSAHGPAEHLNMIVPIDLLKPIVGELKTIGRTRRPPRPWMGLYVIEARDRVVVAGLAKRGPAERADLHTGDALLAVAGQEVRGLASLFRHVWALGTAGIEVPLTVMREGATFDVRLISCDRNSLLKQPRLH
jgi:S1-C subfamily serine protease